MLWLCSIKNFKLHWAYRHTRRALFMQIIIIIRWLMETERQTMLLSLAIFLAYLKHFCLPCSTKCGCVLTAAPTHSTTAVINYAVCDLGKYGMMTFRSANSSQRLEIECAINKRRTTTMSWWIYFFSAVLRAFGVDAVANKKWREIVLFITSTRKLF